MATCFLLRSQRNMSLRYKQQSCLPPFICSVRAGINAMTILGHRHLVFFPEGLPSLDEHVDVGSSHLNTYVVVLIRSLWHR